MANKIINSLQFNSGDINILSLPYGICETAAATAAKVVTVENFALETGAQILVKFTVTNSASSPTLNINGTGAKNIMYRGSAISAGYLAANRVYEFVYDGTDWELVGDINVDNDKKTASGNTSSKIFLIGATTQSTSGQTTYSHDTAYVGTDGHLYDSGERVITPSQLPSIEITEVERSDTTDRPEAAVVEQLAYGSTITLVDEVYKGSGSHDIQSSIATYKLPSETIISVGNKSSTDTTDLVYAVTNLVESGTSNHTITPTYTGLPTKTYVDKIATGHVKYLGTVTALTGLSTTAGQGDFYRVSTEFTFTDSEKAHVGDIILATKDNPAQNATDWDLIHAEIDSNSWVANTASAAGYVAKGSGNANKVWKTDGSGNPAWRDDANTDTKVTSVDNHYTPTANSDSQLSVDASSTTSATWGSTDLVTGVNIQRDAKGHVTGVTVDSIQMPANPNSNTAHAHTAGTGLTLTSGTGGTSGTTTYAANLNSTSSLGTLGTTSKLYAVGVDANGKLCVNVPWSDSNTDTKVTQTVTTTNANYPLLLAPSGQTATQTTTSYFNSGVTLNPSTNTIAANISGNAGTATVLNGKTSSGIDVDAADGTLRYDYNIVSTATGLFPTVNNANAIITINKHSGAYDSQLGFSANGNLYYRNFNAVSNDTTTSWKQIAFTDSKVSSASSADYATSAGTANSIAWSSITGKPSSFTPASHNHGAGNITSGTLAVDRGGTGKTTLKDAGNAIMNALDTGSSAPQDADYYIAQYAGGGTTTTTYHRRPVSALWTYIKGKTDSLYATAAQGTKADNALPKAGGTLSGRLTADGKITLPSTAGAWISGATVNNASIYISTKQTQSSYHPYFGVQSYGGHTFNLGGLGDQIGFYGYKSGRTENSYDWRFIWDAANGNVTTESSITAAKFYGALSGNADTATTAEKANTLIGLTYTGSNATWGNQTGTCRAYWSTASGGGIQIRDDNPIAGQVSLLIDGTVYVNEGANPVLHTGNYNSYALPLSGGTMEGNLSLLETKNIILRPNNPNYTAGIGYDTSGNECIALWAKNSVTRLRWYAGKDMTAMIQGAMMDITPDFEVDKSSGTVIGRLAGNTIIHSGNIGSQSVASASSADSVAWSNVSGRPTKVSQFSNDSGYITKTFTYSSASSTITAQNNYVITYTGSSYTVTITDSISTGGYCHIVIPHYVHTITMPSGWTCFYSNFNGGDYTEISMLKTSSGAKQYVILTK